MFFQEIIYLKQRMGAYIIDLDELKPIGANWIPLNVNGNRINILIVLDLDIFQKKLKNS